MTRPGHPVLRRPTPFGPLRLVRLLAFRGLRHHRAEAVLLLAALTTATTTLSLACALGAMTHEPWERTRARTAGPDVWVRAVPGHDPHLVPGARGVTTVGPSHPLYRLTGLEGARGPVAVLAQVRDDPRAAVDRPALVAGSWARPGGIVVERAFADALDVGPGDSLRLAGRPLTVTGIAVTTSRAPYPSNTPGLVWASGADEPWIAAAAEHRTTATGLMLADPRTAPLLAAALTTPDGAVSAQAWQDTLDWAVSDQRRVREALLLGAWILALLSLAGVAVLAGGRMADDHRRVGLLKAVGATPRLIACVLLAEHLLVALAAAALGLGLGRLLASLLVRPSPGLLDTDVTLTLTGATALLVVALAVGVTALATLPPAVRAARASTVGALRSPTRGPRRSSTMVGLSARLPVPLLLGLRQAARNPRRTALSVLNLSVTAGTVVSVVCVQHHIARRGGRVPTGIDFVPGTGNPVVERIDQATLAVTVALLALATMNTLLIGWATVLDSARGNALVRALGATGRQVTAALTVAQLLPAAIAGLLGIPIGLALFQVATRLAGVGREVSGPPVTWLAPVPLGTLAVVAVLTLWPARAGSRRPVAEVLAAE